MTSTRLQLIGDVVPKFLLPSSKEQIDLRTYLDSDSVIVDFGCGMGDATISLLRAGNAVLAVDVHTPGICRIAQCAESMASAKLALVFGDGIPALASGLARSSIDTFLVLFPDPWPKARHHKRRLVQLDFLDLIASLLTGDGRLVIVTDDQSYAEHISQITSQCSSLHLTANDVDVPHTRFRQRAINLGNQISTFTLKPAGS
ncbi:MAG: hypothetical protein EBS36_01375 [Actinobacteria bacterium]|nr:hypothetical protein [Actinomycetota bacterium]NBY15137.1 hypothetical protein [Actinomycetota bacterium]